MTLAPPPLRRAPFAFVAAATLAFIACQTSGGSGGARFYSGLLRPIQDVAILLAWDHCSIQSIAVRDGSNLPPLRFGRQLLEVPPGDYQLLVAYGYTPQGTPESPGWLPIPAPVLIRAAANHVYFIMGQFEVQGGVTVGWTPTVVDLASDDDYSKILTLKQRPGRTISLETIKQAIEAYKAGERRQHYYR